VAAITLFGGAALSLGLMSFIMQRQRRLAELETENARLGERNEELERSLVESHLEFATRLVESVGRKDGYTARHAAAATVYTADLAEEFRLDPLQARRLRAAALLQDVGMVSVPEEVLLAPPGRLNSLGKAHLEAHPVESERILSSIPELGGAAKWVRWHHEREDGTGYPDRLRGEWIPLEAKILAAVSHYASLVLESAHSPALPVIEARKELVALSGKALDPLVVRTLLRILDQNGEGYASASDGRFAFSPAAPAESREPGDQSNVLRLVPRTGRRGSIAQ
jgi:HD-GYP domain-containing protein (c-di-GMP phosphodiesterase class II)